VKKLIAAVAFFAALGVFALPAQASAPNSGAITKSHRSLKWQGASFVLSDPAPDPSGLALYAPSCQTDSMCDHYRLKITLGDKAQIQVKITTAHPNPPGTFAGLTSLEPVTGDDYDLFVYDPSGVLVSGAQSTTEKGNETAKFTHKKRFNGKYYDVYVRAWAVQPGSTYAGTVNALTVGR
jgi:hypothetical protein